VQPEGLLETCLYVDDLEAAEEFYRRVLALELHSRVQRRHVFFRCGQGMLLLFNPDETAKPTGVVPTHGAHGPGHAAFAMKAADIQAWLHHLDRQGVDVETEVSWPNGGYSIYFRDPAGNSIELATSQVWNPTTA
jgi:catechol 2,3-dioxygenase-like lactoylglutathione lyase family enzyme